MSSNVSILNTNLKFNDYLSHPSDHRYKFQQVSNATMSYHKYIQNGRLLRHPVSTERIPTYRNPSDKNHDNNTQPDFFPLYVYFGSTVHIKFTQYTDITYII